MRPHESFVETPLFKMLAAWLAVIVLIAFGVWYSERRDRINRELDAIQRKANRDVEDIRRGR